MSPLDLRARYEEARQAWPAVDVPFEDYERFARARLATGAPLEGLHTSDLYLACGCARGAADALAAFDARVVPDLRAALARIDPSQDFAVEVGQLLRVKLFVGASPKIAEYSGRGRLSAWARAVAVRTAIDLVRQRKPTTSDAPLAERALAQGANPELEYVRGEFRDDFRVCFEEALAAMSKRDRAVLRLRYLDEVSLEGIAAVYRVSRSTAHAWLAAARDGLFEDISRRLRERLRLSPRDLESLLVLVRSQLDVSMSRLLRESRSE